MNHDKRLIEDYLPIEAISAEASREKSVRKGHISTLHLWWARRPLVACRAAVYGALVPAAQFVPENGPDNKKQSLGRANAAKFVTDLCKYPGIPHYIKQAQEHILEAHAKRLSAELVEATKNQQWPAWVDEFKWPKEKLKVARRDIEEGCAPRPRVLDMFAGGGAIPLEALRLGCEAYALDLNPVAHIIELCTLVYPQKYGKPDPNVRGMTGPKNEKGEATWGGLAEEVRYWGNWVLKKVKAEIGDLYPLIPDPEYKGKRPEIELDPKTGEWIVSRKGAKTQNKNDPFAPPQRVMDFVEDEQLWLSSQSEISNRKSEIPQGYLMPVAYLWTRTVKCKNPTCGATVPLVKQTWLCKKKDRFVAMKMVAPRMKKEVHFEVVEARTEKGLGFDPEGFSKGGNATCPFCGTVAGIEHIKAEGWEGRLGQRLMAIACARPGQRGKVYVSGDDYPEAIPLLVTLEKRTQKLTRETSLAAPDEPIAGLPSDARENTLGITVRPYGMRTWGDVFTSRQLLSLLTFTSIVRDAENEIKNLGVSERHRPAIVTCLAALIDRLAVYSSTQCVWHYLKGERTAKTFGRQVITMTWDFAESVPFNTENASWPVALEWLVPGIDGVYVGAEAAVHRGSATSLTWDSNSLDAVVTDPPYYDNVPYADLSDYFYVWLKRSVGHIYPEHFAAAATPKKTEAVADSTRHGGSKDRARKAYEDMMQRSFAEAYRVLKPSGQLVAVYAHKTTLGWTTLVDALRNVGFAVVEAWPMNTETLGRLRSQDSAALASSIFLVARKREDVETGNYEKQVKGDLEHIVRERVETLWTMGISGADLVISCVGAGLRAFTRFARVEYANGEEVPAEKFLFEVETVVLDHILARLSMEVGGNGGRHGLAGLDSATRFYVLWRYTYGIAELDAGEAIIFANGTHVELDGPGSLTYGSRPLAEKKKSKYRLLDYAHRGDDDKLGISSDNGASAPLIDALHRTLWLMEHRPRLLSEFLKESGVNRERMRLVAQALAGPALKGGEMGDVSPAGEIAALAKLTANWRSLIEDAGVSEAERHAKKSGQLKLGV